MDIIKITFCVAQWNRQRALVLLRQKISAQTMRRAKLLVAIDWVMNRTSQVHRRMKTGQEPTQPTGSSICSSDIQSGDFGVAVELKKSRSLTDSEKYNFLTKHFVPSANYVFPSKEYGGRARSFQLSRIQKHNGLVYSEKDYGAYCKYCVLFAERHDSRINEFDVLVTVPLTNWKKATGKTGKLYISFLQESVPCTGCRIR